MLCTCCAASGADMGLCAAGGRVPGKDARSKPRAEDGEQEVGDCAGKHGFHHDAAHARSELAVCEYHECGTVEQALKVSVCCGGA